MVRLMSQLGPHYRCANCKTENLIGIRNGDLKCPFCQIYADPNEPVEANLLEVAFYSSEPVEWRSNKIFFVEDGIE